MPANEQSLTLEETGIPAAAQLVTAAGLLPLAVMAVLFAAAVNEIVQISVLSSTIVYGVLVLTFAGGVGWGLAMRRGRFSPSVFIMTAPVAVGWLALVAGALAGLGLLVCGFILFGWGTYLNAQTGVVPAWIGRLSLIASAGFSIALLFMLAWLIAPHS